MDAMSRRTHAIFLAFQKSGKGKDRKRRACRGMERAQIMTDRLEAKDKNLNSELLLREPESAGYDWRPEGEEEQGRNALQVRCE